MKLTIIILTYNEEKHIERCIESLKELKGNIVVVDSYSDDKTVELAELKGAKVIQNKWTNHSRQFNWALTQIDGDTDWVFRIDADEIITPELSNEISSKLSKLNSHINGIFINRIIYFQGSKIRYGGLYPIRILRIFRFGFGKCENRWMDEHIKVSGSTINLKNNLIDNNLNSLSWWIDKHNIYSSKEAIDSLNLEYKFMNSDSIAHLNNSSATARKRWVKEKFYSKLPLGIRSFFYFTYRYFILIGFLDGKNGAVFHYLQGFWYRYLVDLKIKEVKEYKNIKEVSIKKAINDVLGINI